MRAKTFIVGARQQGEQPIDAMAIIAATRGCRARHIADFLNGLGVDDKALRRFISRVSNLFSCLR